MLLHQFTKKIVCSCSESRPKQCLRFAREQERGVASCPDRPDGVSSYPAPPPLPHRRAPPRPDRPVVCPGLRFDKSTDDLRRKWGFILETPPAAHGQTTQRPRSSIRTPINLFVESKTRTRYGPVGSGRCTAGRRGGAKLARTIRSRVDLDKRQSFLLLSSESKTLFRTNFGARTNEILCKLME